MTDIDFNTLQDACRQAWIRETSSAPDRWTEDRPSILHLWYPRRVQVRVWARN